jgi:hypothetical protein
MELQDTVSESIRPTFRSRLSALVRCFRMSRDGWKKKYQNVQQQIRTYRSELRDVRRSREKWRNRAEFLQQENRTLRECLQGQCSDESPEMSPPARSRPSLHPT